MNVEIGSGQRCRGHNWGRMPGSAKSYAKGFLGRSLIPEWPDVYAIFFMTWVLIQEIGDDLQLLDLHHKPSFE